MPFEAFTWNEGSISLWTGAASPSTSAVVGYARNLQGLFAWGYDEHESVDGVYARHLTGMSVDVTIAAVYTYDSTLMRMAQSGTALHMKLNHSSINGSAGYVLYSGHLTTLALAGDETNPNTYTLTYRGNLWSAYP